MLRVIKAILKFSIFLPMTIALTLFFLCAWIIFDDDSVIEEELSDLWRV